MSPNPSRTMRMRTGKYILCVVILLSGCASLAVHTEGVSEPLAWRVTDLALVTRQIDGRAIDGRAFTLVIKNVGTRMLTLRKMDETKYQPGTNPSSASYSGLWVLRPGAEWRIPRFYSLVCNSPRGCADSTFAQPMFRIDIEGVDERNNPVQVRLDITLPPEAMGRPPIVR